MLFNVQQLQFSRLLTLKREGSYIYFRKKHTGNWKPAYETK